MKFVDFELTEYMKDYKYFEEYLEIRYKQDNVKRSVILKEADIYQSAFSLAKKDGLGTHKKIVQKFEKYYGLEKIDKFVLEQLNTHFNNLFIGVYYSNKELTERSYQVIMRMRNLFSKTYISFLFDFFELFYSINSEASTAEIQKQITTRNYISLEKYQM
ncbi:MAG: hypothetical protein IJP28_03885 [Erysipelotrichales bacterium]|nr:hypothetical protein [Erysipelotrichales bacterium]